MLLPNACRHPNRNCCFLRTPFQAKQCNNIDLGERGPASFFAMSLTGWLFFLKNPGPVRERFCGLWMCKHKLEQTPFCTCHNLNPNTLSSSKLLPSKQRSTIFFCLWLCKRKLEQIPFCTRHSPKPQSKHTFIVTAATHKQRMCLQASRSRIAQTACFAQCTHGTVHGHRTP